MPAALCPLSASTQFDAAGRPLVGGRLYVFQGGTTTPFDAYTDPKMTTKASSPVVLTGAGRIPALYLGPGLYDLRLHDSRGGFIDQVAGLQGGTADATGDGTTAAPLVTTGMLMPMFGADVPSGWTAANGRTIGSADSGATGLASADAQALFELLWNENAVLKATVSGGAGATSVSDFEAAKTINLPDLRGRALFGLDGMGAGLAGRITSATTNAPDTAGSVFGSEGGSLTVDQIPTHGHAASTSTAGSHTHAAKTEGAGGHTHVITVTGVADHVHTASTDSQGGHTHTGTTDTSGSHAHDASTGSAGDHNHNGTTDSQNLHFHTYRMYGVRLTGATGATEQVMDPSTFNAKNATDPVDAHAHNYTTSTGGAHTHQVNVVANGTHSHGLEIDPVGGHTHNVTVNGAGAHTHAASADTQANHTHIVDVPSAGDHTHTVTVNTTGSGAAVSRMPPGVLVTWLIKL